MAAAAVSPPNVVHNVAESRYELAVAGVRAAVAEYQLDGNVMTFTHTVTNPALRAQGLAATVVKRALDDARTAGRTVVAQCWFVARFIDQHPDYADLLEPAGSPTP